MYVGECCSEVVVTEDAIVHPVVLLWSVTQKASYRKHMVSVLVC